MPDQPWYAPGLRFTCTQCGNCCSGPPGYVWFNDAEAAAIAQYLHLDEAAFRQRFAHTVDGHWTLNEMVSPDGGTHDCVFLRYDEQSGKALCLIYPMRPTQCQTWPFWPRNLESPEAWERAAQRCPGMTRGRQGKGKLVPLEQVRVIRERMEEQERGA